MKKIICYGDSNTFGFNPKEGSRYDKNIRWTGLLSAILGSDYEIKEEGCNNRTAFFENSDGLLQSGQSYLVHCLEKHQDFDIFILALGTNDLQKFYDINEQVVLEGLKNLISKISTCNPKARIILVSPVLLNEAVLKGPFSFQFSEKSIVASNRIQNIYNAFAEENGLELVDLNKVVSPSSFDGLHFDTKEHKIIAEKLAEQILNKVLY